MSAVAHDVVYALLGFTGKFVVRVDTALVLADVPGVEPSEQALLNRLLQLGACYIELEGFIQAHLFTPFGPASTPPDASPAAVVARPARGQYLVAFAEGIEEALQPYRAAVLETEQQLLRCVEVSLPALQLGLGPFELLLPALRRLVATVRRDNLDGAGLLDFLFSAASSCAAGVRGCISDLLGRVQRVMMLQLCAWLLHGELLPGEHHFFIQRSPKAAGTSLATEEAAARTAGSGACAEAGAAAREASPSASATAAAGESPEGGVVLINEECGFESWGEYEVAVHKKPEVLPMRLAEQVLFIGRAVRVLRRSQTAAAASARCRSRAACASLRAQAGTDADAPKQAAQASGGDEAALEGAKLPKEASAAMQHTIADFNPQLHALATVRGELPLARLQRVLDSMQLITSQLLCHHLLVECELPDLLKALKDYFLLGRGELFHRLVLELRPHTSTLPSPKLDLQGLMQQAATGVRSDLFLQRLRLRLPPHEQLSRSGASAYEAWRQLRLEMDVGWPLRLLLDESNLKRYNELFSFLLLVKRVQTELQAAWSSQTEFGGAQPAERAMLMPLWRLRSHMAFFIDNLQYYLQVDVLETQWVALTKFTRTCNDFEQLCAAHQSALAALHSQCFLQAGSVSSSLHQVFQLCLALCRMLSYVEQGVRDLETFQQQYATLWREFARQSAFLFAFLSNMSSPQASPHLAQLLLRLNFNDFFVQSTQGRGQR